MGQAVRVFLSFESTLGEKNMYIFKSKYKSTMVLMISLHFPENEAQLSLLIPDTPNSRIFKFPVKFY